MKFKATFVTYLFFRSVEFIEKYPDGKTCQVKLKSDNLYDEISNKLDRFTSLETKFVIVKNSLTFFNCVVITNNKIMKLVTDLIMNAWKYLIQLEEAAILEEQVI